MAFECWAVSKSGHRTTLSVEVRHPVSAGMVWPVPLLSGADRPYTAIGGVILFSHRPQSSNFPPLSTFHWAEPPKTNVTPESGVGIVAWPVPVRLGHAPG